MKKMSVFRTHTHIKWCQYIPLCMRYWMLLVHNSYGPSLPTCDFFFFKFLADTCPFLGPLVPLFWISGDVSSGFQSQSGFCLLCYFCGGECNVHSPRFTSGATVADLLAAGAQPVTSPHACAEVGLGSVWFACNFLQIFVA